MYFVAAGDGAQGECKGTRGGDQGPQCQAVVWVNPAEIHIRPPFGHGTPPERPYVDPDSRAGSNRVAVPP